MPNSGDVDLAALLPIGSIHMLTTPKDAGASVLGAFGLKNHIVAWLLNRNPELLALTPKELVRGLKAPECGALIVSYTGSVFPCYRRMVLRNGDAEGRLPRRLVWKCFQHGDGNVPVKEMAPPGMPRPQLALRDMLAAAQRGAILDYQPNPLTGQSEVLIVEKPRKPRKRRNRG